MVDAQPWDVVVVGGGAAGYYTAIRCAEVAPASSRILILERSRRVLQKVKISGGGRCNVTHDTDDRRWLATNYPRGNKALIGPLHKHGPVDVVRWFAAHGVDLKTEPDGRMFPVTDDSQTVVDCLRAATDDLGIELQTRKSVEAISRADTDRAPFQLICGDGTRCSARFVVLATGGTRSGPGAALAASLGHSLEPPVPSLFTFEIDDPRIAGLAGISVNEVEVRAVDTDLESKGPLLITHWGLSGPATLKLSAWGARELHALGYRFTLEVNWLPRIGTDERLRALGQDSGWARRQISGRSPFDALPRRLWQQLVEATGVGSTTTWAELSKAHRLELAGELNAARFEVTGQSVNKDEFVTCGGVPTDQVDMRTMESKRCSGLHFAGELLDLDGVTGGFNFQSAWTTGYLAGIAIAERLVADEP